jgi:ribosomal-protein-alanine N-acetyltransferase
MKAEDAPGVKAVEVECGLSPWRVADYAQDAGRPETIAWIGVAGEAVVGFIFARLITGKENATQGSESFFEIDILNLGVSPSYRRSGLGTRLLQACISRIPENRALTVFLEVRAANSAARAFYSRFGFKESGRRRNFYANPADDAVLMTLERARSLILNSQVY